MKTVEYRFLKKVSVDNNGCWNWTGAKLRDGYGNFVLDTVSHKTIQAHRFSYMFYNGVTITPKEFVCHKCDNPSCVNPKHLFLGNHKENMIDRQIKGRSAKGEKLSILSIDQVKEIRELITNKKPRRAIAKLFGVGPTCITDIATGRTWKWVE